MTTWPYIIFSRLKVNEIQGWYSALRRQPNALSKVRSPMKSEVKLNQAQIDSLPDTVVKLLHQLADVLATLVAAMRSSVPSVYKDGEARGHVIDTAVWKQCM